jgi:Eukaryotic aspartyl protease
MRFLILIALAACTSKPAGPQNDGPPPPVLPLKSAAGTAYILNVTVGGSQTFDVQLDTGSTTFGVVGANCSDCTDITPVYTPGATAMDLGSAASSQYGLGEWDGEIYTDTVVATGDTLAPFTMKFVDIDAQMEFFSTENDFQGILGFGPPELALTDTDAYVSDRVAAGSNGVFAIQMCHYNGNLWFGDADKTHEVSDEQYTSLLPVGSDEPYYLMSVQGMSVDGASLNLTGVALPDTGTTSILLPATAGAAFSAAMNANSGFLSMFNGQDFEVSGDSSTCLTTPHSAAEIDAALPKLQVTFNDLDGNPFTLSLSATESYLTGIGEEYCIVVGTADLGTFNNQPFFIMGDGFLRSFISVYDPANSKIGFAPQQGCVDPDDAHEPTKPFVPRVRGVPMFQQ